VVQETSEVDLEQHPKGAMLKTWAQGLAVKDGLIAVNTGRGKADSDDNDDSGEHLCKRGKFAVTEQWAGNGAVVDVTVGELMLMELQKSMLPA
jgi:hypothetical protein